MRRLLLTGLVTTIAVMGASSSALAAPQVEVHTVGNRCITERNARQMLPGQRIDADEDEYAQSAANALVTTYWFFKHYFDRESFDGRGREMSVTVHAKFGFGGGECNGNNAMYDNNNSRFLFGDGDDRMMHMPGGALDLVAHEFTHGVTHYESNLTYKDESGALNEALSDIFGVATEIWANSGGGEAGNPERFIIDDESYTMGEEIVADNAPDPSRIIRLLNDPSRHTDNYPDTYSEYKKTLYIDNREICQKDHGCVHFNMSLASLAFYLLAEGGKHPQGATDVTVEGIGIEKALKIYYHAATNTFDSSTDHRQARRLLANSAETLYGECSRAWHAVNRSFDAIEVDVDWTPCDCDADNTESCSPGDAEPDADEPEDRETEPVVIPPSESVDANDMFDVAKSLGGMGQGMITASQKMLEGFAEWSGTMLDTMIKMTELFGGNNTSFGRFATAGARVSRAGLEIFKDVAQMVGRMAQMIGRIALMAGKIIDMMDRMQTAANVMQGAMDRMEEMEAQGHTRALTFIPDASSIALLFPLNGHAVSRHAAPGLLLSNEAKHYRLLMAPSLLMHPAERFEVEVTEESDLDAAWSTLCRHFDNDRIYLAAQAYHPAGYWTSLSNVVRLTLTDEADEGQARCDEQHLTLCLREASCLDAGGVWCEDGCQAEACAEDPEIFANLALDARISASSFYNRDLVPAHLNDDDRATHWASRPLQGPWQEEWISFGLAGERPVSQVIIDWNGNGFAQAFGVFIGRDGQWVLVYDGTKSSTGSTVAEFETTQTTEVLIRMRNGANRSWFDIREIEIW